METSEKLYRSLWINNEDQGSIQIIDQRYLPFELVVRKLKTPGNVYTAISKMQVRGAPLIGVTAAFGVYLTYLYFKNDPDRKVKIKKAIQKILLARPTAVNLQAAIQFQLQSLFEIENYDQKITGAYQNAVSFMNMEIEACRKIGEFGLPLIEAVYNQHPSRPVQILTHCNAGWLATIEWGTALAPVYLAHKKLIPVHVWVDETRPRNQGARLTTWELNQAGIPHTLIADNTGGLLMQQGKVDMVITGSDRTALNGDTANKIGTYLKALAAHDNGIPFFVALPTSSIDRSINNGDEIPIEQREEEEVTCMTGRTASGVIDKIQIVPNGTPARNYGFDITPARLIDGLITEKGICKARKPEIIKLFSKNTETL